MTNCFLFNSFFLKKEINIIYHCHDYMLLTFNKKLCVLNGKSISFSIEND